MDRIELNADFTERAAMHGGQLPWQTSPMQGVERRMLDRIGGEVARATTIVRFAANSHFSPHVHTGGEEFLVLDGVFQDEHADYPKGSYIRNPPGTSHTPGSDEGCTILVKLWQFDMADKDQIVRDTNAMEMQSDGGRAGVSIIPLFSDVRETVRLEKWDADAEIAYEPQGGLEVFVINGGFNEGGETFTTHSWLRLPEGASLTATSGAEGCLCWVKEGHLAHLDLGRFK